MTIEFDLEGYRYRAEKLNAFEQFAIARRLLPVIGGVADFLVKAVKSRESVQASVASLFDSNIADAIEPLTKALGAMSDEDCRAVQTGCLSKVSRQQPNGSWAPILAPNGSLMFLDIDMLVMVQILWKVIEDNLLNFSRGPLADSISAGRA